MLTVSGGGGAGGPASLTLQVAPEDLYQQANDFDRAARLVDQAISDNARALLVEAAGADEVSQAAAKWFNDSAFDPSTGVLAQMHLTADEFRKAADAMRAAARSYGLQDQSNAGDIGGTKT